MILDGSHGILVTGGTGFIGSNLIAALLEENKYAIYCIIRPGQSNAKSRLVKALSGCKGLSDKKYLAERVQNIHIIEGDILDPDIGLTGHLKNNVKTLWHCAAVQRPGHSYSGLVMRNNFEGTKNILSLGMDLNIVNFNFISTAFVERTGAGAIDSASFCHQDIEHDPYTCSKFLAEKFLIKECAKSDIDLNIFRPDLVIGNSKTFGASSQSGLYKFCKMIEQFKEWMIARVPGYFETNELHIYSRSNPEIGLIPVDMAVEEMLRFAAKKAHRAPETVRLTNDCKITLVDLVKVINLYIRDIRICVTDKENDMNAFDKLFIDKLNYYTPFIFGNKSSKNDSGLDQSKVIGIKYDDKILSYNIRNYFDLYTKMQDSKSANIIRIANKFEKKVIRSRTGTELVYYTFGDGEPMILLTAYGINHRIWDHVIEGLISNYKMIVWEVRGLYNHQKPSEDNDFIFGVNEQVGDIEEILQNENSDKAHLLSWCSGTKISLVYTLKHPLKVKSLILIAGEYAPYPGSETHNTQYKMNMKYMADLVKTSPKLLKYYMNINNFYPTDPTDMEIDENNITRLFELIDPKYREMVLAPYKSEETIANYIHMCMEYYEHDVTSGLKDINMPVLVISARNDQIVHPKQSEDIAGRIAGSEYIDMPLSTHFLIRDNHEDVLEEIRFFLGNYHKAHPKN